MKSTKHIFVNFIVLLIVIILIGGALTYISKRAPAPSQHSSSPTENSNTPENSNTYHN